ncbi:peptidase S8/S53 domain-containing protein [Microdochium trichocladiopsis]|uniref:Peptidase S8/S53 domain-containing protein n=1 Tax=Microdochium trichocladiopsis TaxID=1682393 RepID=A0A9P8YA24_9PEZI|nr:peptidase S8/S53 domain-containing protein [Microdochium trichocladiopsis]KAH7032564.1 peptidase S8/S53 domain-containing protein [Microdochium trichocladiopsis]
MVKPQNLLAVLSALVPSIAALPIEDTGAGFASYIISLKRGLNDSDIDSHYDFANDMHRRALARRGVSLSPTTGETGIMSRHEINEHRSYAAVFDEATREAIASHPPVALVERNEIISIGHQSDAPWGLVSMSLNWTSGTPLAADSYRFYKDGQGQGMTAYVVDTGVRITHGDFEKRAGYGANFIKTEDHVDGTGHGTHVAGTIGGKTFGVAKQINIISVKVLDKEGNGPMAQTLEGFQWAYQHARRNKRLNKSLVNYSAGGEGATSAAIRDAILEMKKAGMAVFVSAGNDDMNVDNAWPANVPEVFTVASAGNTGNRLWRARSSNYGKLVDMFGPGVNILSCGHKSDKATARLSGTSQATPHVTGFAATLKSRLGSKVDSVDTLYKTVLSYAVRGRVEDAKGSPNLFLANGLEVVVRPPTPGPGSGTGLPVKPPM